MTRLPRFLATAVLGLLAAAPAWCQPMVANSTGPCAAAYPIGRTIPDKYRLELKAGDVLVLAVDSRLKTLRGPGVFTSEDKAVAVTPVELGPERGARPTISAVRSMSHPKPEPVPGS
jgi:hypothetical protein